MIVWIEVLIEEIFVEDFFNFDYLSWVGFDFNKCGCLN